MTQHPECFSSEVSFELVEVMFSTLSRIFRSASLPKSVSKGRLMHRAAPSIRGSSAAARRTTTQGANSKYDIATNSFPSPAMASIGFSEAADEGEG